MAGGGRRTPKERGARAEVARSLFFAFTPHACGCCDTSWRGGTGFPWQASPWHWSSGCPQGGRQKRGLPQLGQVTSSPLARQGAPMPQARARCAKPRPDCGRQGCWGVEGAGALAPPPCLTHALARHTQVRIGYSVRAPSQPPGQQRQQRRRRLALQYLARAAARRRGGALGAARCSSWLCLVAGQRRPARELRRGEREREPGSDGGSCRLPPPASKPPALLHLIRAGGRGRVVGGAPAGAGARARERQLGRREGGAAAGQSPDGRPGEGAGYANEAGGERPMGERRGGRWAGPEKGGS